MMAGRLTRKNRMRHENPVAQVRSDLREYVEKPEDIRPALERAAAAVAGGKTAVVNVVTDWTARAGTVRFTAYST